MLPKLGVDVLLQHTLCLFNIQVGRLQPKNQDVHAHLKTILDSGVVRRVELKRDGPKYMRAHLEGGIFRHGFHGRWTILCVAEGM